MAIRSIPPVRTSSSRSAKATQTQARPLLKAKAQPATALVEPKFTLNPKFPVGNLKAGPEIPPIFKNPGSSPVGNLKAGPILTEPLKTDKGGGG